MCVYLCARADANKAAVAAKGGIEAVVAAMRRHEGVAGVAEHGCGALWNIAVLGGWSAAVRARAAGGAGRGSGSGSAAASARGAATCVRAVVCAVCRHAVGGRCTAGGACVCACVWARSLGAAE